MKAADRVLSRKVPPFVDDAAHITSLQGTELSREQASKPGFDSDHLPPAMNGAPNDCADRRVHSRRIATTGEHGDILWHWTPPVVIERFARGYILGGCNPQNFTRLQPGSP
jgi:hypothetical protein